MAARESNSTSGSFSAAQSTAPQMQKRSLLPYGGFDTMPIAGEWRPGNAGRHLTDRNPYTGETLLEIPQALTPLARGSVLMQADDAARYHWHAGGHGPPQRPRGRPHSSRDRTGFPLGVQAARGAAKDFQVPPDMRAAPALAAVSDRAPQERARPH